jgi:hypothetical protein
MSATDPRNDLRATLADLDDRQRKIVGGLIAVMIENPERVKEREWITEQFTQITLIAAEFEDVGSVQEGVERVQTYVRANADELLATSYQLFQLVAEDLAPRVAEGISRTEAVAHALGYLAQEPT